MFVFSTS